MSGLTVGYDARPLQPQTRHWGPGVFLENMIQRLRTKARFVGIAHNFPGAVEQGIKTWPAIPKVKRIIFEFGPVLLDHYDVFWGTAHFLPLWLRAPSVVTLHDLLIVAHRDGEPVPRLSAWRLISSLRRATKIVASSHTTADDLLARFPDFRAKVEVAPLGYDWNPGKISIPPSLKADPRPPFAIMLGAHRPRKNLGLALEAVSCLRGKGKKVDLLVTGDIHPSFESAVQRKGEMVKKVGTLPREELFALLTSAVALIYPSRYEGFGLPILEAMAAGCPVLALETPIAREVGGIAAWLLPDDARAWADALCMLLNSPRLREEMVQKGIQNLKRFSWERTAATYGEIFEVVGR